METFNKTADFLKIPAIFRDFIMLVGGFGSMLFFSFLVPSYNIFSKVQTQNLSSFEKDLIILIIAYLTGRLLVLMSSIFLELFKKLKHIFVFFVCEDTSKIKVILEDFKNNWKNKIKDTLFFDRSLKNVSYDEVKDVFSLLEYYQTTEKISSFNNEEERSGLSILFIRICFSTSILAFILIDNLYFIAVIIFYFLFVLETRRSKRNHYEIYKSFIKERGKPDFNK